MNNFNKLLNGLNYKIKRNSNGRHVDITHKPTGSYVTLYNRSKYVEILNGKTPNTARGKGVGTNLRALATMYAIMKNKPIIQFGVNIEKRSVARRKNNPSASNLPTSTYILRHVLGWKPRGKTNHSQFLVGNDTTAVKNRVSNIKRRSTNAQSS
jgi:hypothetical protein